VKIINNQAFKRRSTVVFAALSVIMMLSSYFIIAYFLAMKTFTTASEVIEQLEIIFYKGSCFDSAMNFLRENQIRNESMLIISTDIQSASDYYINFCYQKEVDYNKMRTSMPLFFDGAKNFIDEMESGNLCNYVYGSSFPELVPTCKNALNGILNKGLTNAFYYMFTQILK